MGRNKIELEDLLGLKDSKLELQLDLTQDIQGVMDKFFQEAQEREAKNREFIQLFKDNYNELVKIMELDPLRRVSVNCLTCVRGMNLRDQYGVAKKK